MNRYPEEEFFGFNRVDSTILFYNFINSICRNDSAVVDFGAGRAEYFEDDLCPYRRDLRALKGKVARVIGIDVDDAIFRNHTLDEAKLIGQDGRIPLGDGTVDLILADWVLEHILEPKAVVSEFFRILKPGGYLCARTPNGHGYIALGARLIPQFVHDSVLAWAQPNRKREDVFPKFYKLNTAKKLATVFHSESFDLVTFCVDSSPSYAGRSTLTYSIFQLLHKVTPEPLKSIRFVFARKRY